MAWSAPAGGRHGPAGHDPDTTVPVRMWCRSARSRSRMLTAELFFLQQERTPDPVWTSLA